MIESIEIFTQFTENSSNFYEITKKSSLKSYRTACVCLEIT